MVTPIGSAKVAIPVLPLLFNTWVVNVAADAALITMPLCFINFGPTVNGVNELYLSYMIQIFIHHLDS